MKLPKKFLIGITSIFFSGNVLAIDIYVTRFDDSYPRACDSASGCTLREAVTLANSLPGADHIKLSAGTYILDYDMGRDDDFTVYEEDKNIDGDLDIKDDLVISGSTSGTTIIDSAHDDRIFEVLSGSTLLSHLTLTNARHTEYGGAIENHATLTIQYSSIIHNSAWSSVSIGAGGGIANFGTLNIYFSTIADNYALAGVGHPGQGGGIYNAGNLTIRDSTISDNRSFDHDESSTGSGLFNKGYADIRRTLFTRNHSGGYKSYGAAIMNAQNGQVKLVSSTVSNNNAGQDGKGAVANGSPTISGGSINLTNVTIADNANFGLYNKAHMFARNSIISGNYQPEIGLAQNCFNEGNLFISLNTLFGLEGFPTCPGAYDFFFDNNKTFISLLSPLADNGGPTLTHALKWGSVGIDRVNDDVCPTSDQRSYFTNFDGNNDGVARCDLGAVEYQP